VACDPTRIPNGDLALPNPGGTGGKSMRKRGNGEVSGDVQFKLTGSESLPLWGEGGEEEGHQ